MAKNRLINTKFWTDSYIIDTLNPIDKLLFLYLITNPYTDISGVYELSLKIMAVETGIDRENIEKVILPRFEKDEKILYRNGWIAIKNFKKHQVLNPKVIRGMIEGLNRAPKELREWIENDSLSIENDSLSHINTNTNTNININSNINFKKYIVLPKKQINQKDTETILEDGKKETGNPFETFWSEYPIKVGKKMAEKIFIKLAPDIIPQIIEDIKKRKLSHRTWLNGYIPNPSTYLNGERWNDEIISPNNQSFGNLTNKGPIAEVGKYDNIIKK